MNKEAILDNCIEIVEKRRATFVRAEILDRDNQLVATGEVISSIRRRFSGVSHQTIQKKRTFSASRAAVLRRSDGTSQKILRCERCQHSLHFHLEIEP